MKADRIFVNGSIAYTGRSEPRTQAIAAWHGHVVVVGPDDEVLALRGPSTEVIDLRGRLVLPGFTDSHVHFLSFSLQHTGRLVDLREARSLAEALDVMRQWAGRSAEGDWIRGGGWDKNRWTTDPSVRAAGAFPTRWDLDAVAPRNPVFLSNKDGHSAWVNSRALAAAGMTRETRAPEGGAILRDASGEPTGILQDAAIGLVAKHLPAFSASQQREALVAGAEAANALGLTGIHNCEGAEVLACCEELTRRGQLSLRVVSYLPGEALEHASRCGLRSGFGDEWHRVGGLKLFVDGALGSQTAAMLEPLEASENRGLLQVSPEELASFVRRAAEAGLSCAIHAIGDRANRLALDAFEGMQELSAHHRLRQRIEHAQHLTEEDLPRFARLGVTASMQPIHVPGDIDMAERHLGSRCRWAYPFGSLLRSGANVAFGSDAPVESLDPLAGIAAAVNRQRPDGTPAGGWHPEERVSVEEAVQCYTLGAAVAAGKERDEGSLHVGKLADLVVLSDDIFAMPAARLNEARVVLTVVGGEVVFWGEG